MPFNETIDHLHIELTRIFKETYDYKVRYKNAPAITWSWVAIGTAHIMKTYPTGLTDTILLADLETLWEHHCLMLTSQKFDTIFTKYDLEARQHTLFLDCHITALEFKHDSIWLATLKDDSRKELDMYLPLKCNPWFATPSPISPYLQHFGNNRHLRFRCPPRTNTPLLTNTRTQNDSVTTHHDPTSIATKDTTPLTIPRSDRVITCAPTNDCMWQLRVNDATWIRDVFWRDTFATVIAPESMAAAAAGTATATATASAFVNKPTKRHQLWVKVVHVEKDTLLTNAPASLQQQQQQQQAWLHQKRHWQQRRHRKDIYIVDHTNDTEPALLSLYDDQTDMTRMMERGDYLGLYDPVVTSQTQLTPSQEQQTDLVFEWGPNTMVFWMTNKEAMQAGVTKMAPMTSESSILVAAAAAMEDEDDEEDEKDGAMREFFGGVKRTKRKAIMARDDEGLMDCLNYVPRIKICDLEHAMSNITLTGRLIAKANNNPFIDPVTKQRMDRYAIRIQDETGKIDVTLWEQTGKEAKQLRIGERLVLTGLSTSVKQVSASGETTWYVNGSAVCGTLIYNVSQCECLLVSHGFGTMTPLHKIQGDGQWETQATIVGWKLRGIDPTLPALYGHEMPFLNDDDDDFCLADYIIVQAHVDCSEMLPGPQQCDYCAKELLMEDEKIWVYRQRKQMVTSEDVSTARIGWIEWRLDDGHGVLDAYGAEQTILDCPAVEFMTLSPQLQIKLLDSVVGTEWSCSISCVGTRGYRLDKIAPEQQLHSKCGSLVKSLSDLLVSSK